MGGAGGGGGRRTAGESAPVGAFIVRSRLAGGEVNWCAPCFPEPGYWILRPPESQGGPHGAAWVSGGVPSQGAGSGRVRPTGRRCGKALGISDQTIYTWRRQDRIDKGLEPGLTSAEKSELEVARRRIAALEAELAVHRRASELLGKVVPPKGGSRPSR
jgi:transposase